MIAYIIQVSFIWIALFILYTLSLSHETFFKANRLYLLGSLVLGLLAPFIIPYLSHNNELPPVGSYITQISEIIISDYVPTQAITWDEAPLTILMIVYLIGACLHLMRFIIGLIYLRNLYRNGTKEIHQHYQLIVTSTRHKPFSFFNLIFIHAQDMDQRYLSTILNHELVHTRAGHSIDIIFVQLLQIIFWFNPILSGYKNALKEAHEYMADHAITFSFSKETYSMLLLGCSSSGDELTIVNPFFNSLIKKRIKMMYTNQSTKSASIKYIFALPVFVITVMTLSTYKIQGQTIADLASDQLIAQIENITPQPQSEATPTHNNDEQINQKYQPQKDTLDQGWPAKALIIFDGKSIADPKKIDPNEISSINVLKGETAIAKYGDKGKHGVVEITSKTSQQQASTQPDELARFPGADATDSQLKFVDFLVKNIKYPASAKKYGVEGKVILRYTVDEKGLITDVNVVRGISPDCDAEAKRVVELMSQETGPWTPATKDGQTVKSSMHLPINFKLQPLTDASKIVVDNATFSYYPNPANDYIMVDIKGDYDPNAIVAIINIKGTAVKQLTNLHNGLNEINTSDLLSGEYVIQIINGKTIKTDKIIIQK
jgi:TonB family protein